LSAASLVIGDAAPKIVAALPAKSVAALARVARRKTRRLMAPQIDSSFISKRS